METLKTERCWSFFYFLIFCIAPFWCYASSSEQSLEENPTDDCESIFGAIEKNRVGNVERLLVRGVSLEERDSKGLTPILYAIGRLDSYLADKDKVEKIIVLLVEKGANLEAADPQGNSSLLKCCGASGKTNDNYLFLTKVFLDHGADLEARNQWGNTPLLVATMYENNDILKSLLEKNADKEARNNLHKTALMLAAENNYVKTADVLLKAGAIVDSIDDRGMTPLMYASYRGNIAVMQILLQNNADLTATLTKDVVIESKEKEDRDILFRYFSPPPIQTIIPAGSTALTFAEKIDGRGAEKILLEAWAKKDPTMERALMEWKKKVTEL